MKLNKVIVINMLVTLGFLSACNSGSSKTNQVSDNSLTPSATKPQNSLVIKNGESVHIPELNALVPLVMVKVSSHRHRLCTGVFLEPNKILTASHCVLKFHDKRVGETFESKDLYSAKRMSIIFPKNLTRPINYRHDSSKHWNKYSVKAVYVKPDAFKSINISSNDLSVYNYDGVNDLAILELTKAPQYKFHMELASVAPEIGTEQIVIGFGHNTGKNFKDKGQSHGNSGVMRFGKTVVSNITRINHPTLRIGGAVDADNAPYVVACKGDSGGPSLTYNESNSYTVTGITSLGFGKDSCSSSPDVYMSVAYYKDWIESGYLTNSLRVGNFPKQ
ncbi:MAG: hypothetical protein RLZZ293_537 [Pseudomonadota bacterium]